jgi:hypothetical protein
MVERRDDILDAQSKANFDAQTLSSEEIQDRQRSNPTPVSQLIYDKVHIPQTSFGPPAGRFWLRCTAETLGNPIAAVTA